MRLSLCVSLLLLAACTAPPSGRVRISAEVVGKTLNLSASLEGPEGQSLSGALVYLSDPSQAVQVLGFTKNAYTWTGSATSGVYTLGVDSLKLGKQHIPFRVQVFTESPEIVSVQDGNGAKAEEFKQLSAATPIRIAWKGVQGAQRYLVEVRQNGLKAAFISQETALVLEPNLLSSGPASLQVTANAASGSLDNYSSTSLESPSYSVQVGP
jgi:hypothetical protein